MLLGEKHPILHWHIGEGLPQGVGADTFTLPGSFVSHSGREFLWASLTAEPVSRKQPSSADKGRCLSWSGNGLHGNPLVISPVYYQAFQGGGWRQSAVVE